MTERRKNREPRVIKYCKFVRVEGWGKEEGVFSLSIQSLEYIIFVIFLNCVFYCLILQRERERERERYLLFHLFMYSLVESCMCPDQGSNPQHQCMGTML